MFMQNMLAHAELGKLFDLPVIMTTSTETGPNGPLPKEIVDMFPDAPIISRKGEVKYVIPDSIMLLKQCGSLLLTSSSAWDDPAFREAVRKTGKKQFIIGGIVTDVCTSFLALSLRSEG
jgi:nicotinamidase-related amidase